MKRSFFQAAVASILLYGCTTWTLTKRLEKKLDGNYTRMLRAILNKSWWQHPTRHQLYGHLPPITKTIQVRRTRHAGHCWRSRDELISDVLLWTPTHGRAKAERPARTYIQQLCEDTRCCPEDLPETMNDREKWRERVRDIRATSTTWLWWWWWWKSNRYWQPPCRYIIGRLGQSDLFALSQLLVAGILLFSLEHSFGCFYLRAVKDHRQDLWESSLWSFCLGRIRPFSGHKVSRLTVLLFEVCHKKTLKSKKKTRWGFPPSRKVTNVLVPSAYSERE